MGASFVARATLTLLVALALAGSAEAATGWLPDETLPPVSTATGASPVVAMAPDGYAIAAWPETLAVGQSAIRVSVHPLGGPWSAPVQFDAGPGRLLTDAAIADDGTAAVAWNLQAGGSRVISRAGEGAFVPTTLAGDAPAIGIDGAGKVSVLETRLSGTGAVLTGQGGTDLSGGSLGNLGAASCLNPGQGDIAVAADGTAVAAYACGGATFGTRTGNGAWAGSTPFTNSFTGSTGCASSSTTYSQPRVAIDAQHNFSAGFVRTQFDNVDDVLGGCSQQSVFTLMSRLTTGAGFGAGPDVTTSATMGVGSSLQFSGLGVGGGEVVFGWAPGTSGAMTRRFAIDGTSPHPAAPLTSGFSFAPALALTPDGHGFAATAVIGAGGRIKAVVAQREPGADFGSPSDVSDGATANSNPAVATATAGDALVGYARADSTAMSPTYTTRVRAYDNTPPAVSTTSIPASGTAGVPLSFGATATDVWGPLTYAWSFSDGATAAGSPASHAFAIPGNFTASVTAADALGNTAAGSGSVAVSAATGPTGATGPPPALSKVSVTNATFRVGSAPTAVSAAVKKRAPVGTRFRFTVDEPSTASLRMDRAASGRRVGKRCLAPTRARIKARRKRCTRYLKAGTLTRKAKQGANSVPFSGRIGRRRLSVATYRLTLTARANGRTSRARALKFRIVK
jgi:hypothetical protein